MADELTIVKVLNPLFCGFPSHVMDYTQERISLDKEYVKHPLSTYLFQASGNSMINAFITPKSKLLVDRSLTPENGDIVVAIVNGEFTVKFLKKNTFKCWLCSANSKYPDIEITEEMEMKILGVVTSILTDAKDVRQCMF